MSQQQPPFQGTQGQRGQFESQQMGNQPAMQGQTGQQSTGQAQGGKIPQQYRTAVQSVADAIAVCEWCAEQCVLESNPDMVECIRLCEDVAELGETTLALVPRQSRYADKQVQTFLEAVQACAQECGMHQRDHCQECATVLSQTLQQAQQLQGTTGQQPQQYQ